VPDPLPCPFCGADDIAFTRTPNHLMQASCLKCRATGPVVQAAAGELEVAIRWNTRAAPESASVHGTAGSVQDQFPYAEAVEAVSDLIDSAAELPADPAHVPEDATAMFSYGRARGCILRIQKLLNTSSDCKLLGPALTCGLRELLQTSEGASVHEGGVSVHEKGLSVQLLNRLAALARQAANAVVDEYRLEPHELELPVESLRELLQMSADAEYSQVVGEAHARLSVELGQPTSEGGAGVLRDLRAPGPPSPNLPALAAYVRDLRARADLLDRETGPAAATDAALYRNIAAELAHLPLASQTSEGGTEAQAARGVQGKEGTAEPRARPVPPEIPKPPTPVDQPRWAHLLLELVSEGVDAFERAGIEPGWPGPGALSKLELHFGCPRSALSDRLATRLGQVFGENRRLRDLLAAERRGLIDVLAKVEAALEQTRADCQQARLLKTQRDPLQD
jgi:hypothetical protein